VPHDRTGLAMATTNDITTCLLRDDDETRATLSKSQFLMILDLHEYGNSTVSTDWDGNFLFDASMTCSPRYKRYKKASQKGATRRLLYAPCWRQRQRLVVDRCLLYFTVLIVIVLSTVTLLGSSQSSKTLRLKKRKICLPASFPINAVNSSSSALATSITFSYLRIKLFKFFGVTPGTARSMSCGS